MQKQTLRNKMLLGKFACLLELYTSDGRKRADADNRIKSVLDYATRVGLIKDDSYCEKGTFMWVSAEAAPEYGCRLTLWDFEEKWAAGSDDQQQPK
jgi:Holliday junction resolvase RusA-like endonuclease